MDLRSVLLEIHAALDALREDALSEAAWRDFRASARATAAWHRAHPTTLDGILDWIDQLRAAFGDPPVDRRPWRGGDFRIWAARRHACHGSYVPKLQTWPSGSRQE
jgi:hypothetical protein